MWTYPDKPKSEDQEKVEAILSQSDIVWGKYGSDTIENLAARIVAKLKGDKN